MSDKTMILKIKGDWKEVVNDCRFTVGKKNLAKEPSTDFKKRILISEHTPIRDIAIKWAWPSMPHWVTVHWVRHKFEKFVRTQRTDRTGIDRTKLTQDEPQDFIGEANVQHLIDALRKRLCFQSAKETREYAEDLKAEITASDMEIGNVLVPNCIYRGGCPEINGCAYFDSLLSKDNDIASTDIQKRYDAYNKTFWASREVGE